MKTAPVLIATFLTWATASFAQVSCGDTITDEQTLTGSLVCGAHDPALTIDGGKLNMNGFSISGCLGDGILLSGEKSEVMNGRVIGCDFGFRLGGVGKHKVTNVYATGNSVGFFFQAGSDKNKLVNAHASGNSSDGFQIVGGEKLSFASCTSIGNSGFGFSAGSSATAGKFKDCLADGNNGDGFHIPGGASFKNCSANNNSMNGFNNPSTTTKSKYKGCSAVGNTLDGFNAEKGDKLAACFASGNGRGFDLHSDAALTKSSAVGNGEGIRFVLADGAKANKVVVVDSTGDGIEISNGTGIQILGSTIVGSTGRGIHNGAGTGMKIVKNVVLQSGSLDIIENEDCVDNIWKDNVFDTASPCVE